MLTNVFRRLYLSESEATVNVPSGSVIREGSEAAAQVPAFLNVPIDILVLFLDYLHNRDLIALSLTTKKLRWVRPAVEPPEDPLNNLDHILRIPPTVKARLEQQRKAEALCSRRTHQRFLPPSRNLHDKCPYCAHPLCPPSCPTALFLDTRTGIFYPAQLYRTNKAVFKYCTGVIQKLFFKPQTPTRPDGDDRLQRIVYSTIWCEHHRCPRDLFSQSNCTSSQFSGGAQRFLGEYTPSGQLQWRTAGCSKELGHWIHGRWRVGYKLLDLNTLNTASKVPVHEAFYYASLCLHCLHAATYQMIGSIPTPVEYSCSCEYAGNRRGCSRCGATSVKFTRIEVFDLPDNRRQSLPREGFWLYLAIDYKPSLSTNPRSSEPRRLYPANPQKAEKLLSIVRGFTIIPLPPPTPKIRLQDLPYPILRQIVLTLTPQDPLKFVKFEDSDYFCLCASYCFIKAAFGKAGPLKSLEYLKEPWFLMCTGRKGGFNSTEVFWKGQIDQKVREEQWKAARIAWSMGTGLRDLLAQK
ncbi:hypothetical protein TWF281_007969 [Arthrobotrys megalospora]